MLYGFFFLSFYFAVKRITSVFFSERERERRIYREGWRVGTGTQIKAKPYRNKWVTATISCARCSRSAISMDLCIYVYMCKDIIIMVRTAESAKTMKLRDKHVSERVAAVYTCQTRALSVPICVTCDS